MKQNRCLWRYLMKTLLVMKLKLKMMLKQFTLGITGVPMLLDVVHK